MAGKNSSGGDTGPAKFTVKLCALCTRNFLARSLSLLSREQTSVPFDRFEHSRARLRSVSRITFLERKIFLYERQMVVYRRVTKKKKKKKKI